jgi:hypothetical protein
MRIRVLKSSGESVEIDGVREVAIDGDARVEIHRAQSRDHCGNFLYQTHAGGSPITVNDLDAADPRPRVTF